MYFVTIINYIKVFTCAFFHRSVFILHDIYVQLFKIYISVTKSAFVFLIQ